MSSSSGGKCIATHDGTFHCDEITACYMLKQLPEFKNHGIIRTRDKSILNSSDIVVDVGGVHDFALKRFDHHQRTFQKTIKDFHPNIKSTNPNRPIKLSSAGLIYAHYGKDFIKEVLEALDCPNSKTSDEIVMLEAIYMQFYHSFMEEIDAIDNGVEMVDGENLVHNYHLSTHLAARVHRLNSHDASAEHSLEKFQQAMSVVGEEMIDRVRELATIWWPSLISLRKYVLDRFSVHESGAIVEVPSDAQTTWRSTILHIEEQLSIEGQIKFILFNNPHDHTKWRIMAMPVSLRSFQSRLALKEEWRGLEGNDLRERSGISDANFVHNTGFTGGANSKESCIALAIKTIESELQ